MTSGKRFTVRALALVAGLFLLVACGSTHRAPAPAKAQTTPPPVPQPLVHQVGAFNISSVTEARAAAAAGVSIDYVYGMPPSPASALGRELKDLGITVVSARVSGLVHDYECQRLRADTGPSIQRYCQGVTHTATSESGLLAQVRTYARAAGSNPLVSGYWILDDQPGTDFGSLRGVEDEVAAILHHYGPSRPTICGVGAFMTTGGGYSFDPALLRDVTAGACDEIGLYVYTAPQTPPSLTASTTYDWSMSALLSTLLGALSTAGLGNVPWIGVGQAWGGINRLDGNVVVTPSTEQMIEQAGAFCRAGASAMTWYAWTLTAFRQLESPATDDHLAAGVTQGGRACASRWAGYPATPSAGSDEPLPG